MWTVRKKENYPVEHTERLIITYKSCSSIQKSGQHHMSGRKNWKESSCLPSIQTSWVLRDFFLLLIILHSYTHMNAHTYIHNHQYSQINYGKAKLSYFNIPDHSLLKISFIRLKQQQQQNYVIKSLWSLDSLLFYL